MADLNVSLILRLVDKASAPARAAMRMIDRMGGEGVMRQAARVQRGSVMMASGLGTVAGTATRAVGVLGDYRTILAGIGIGAIAGGFIRTAAEFERYNVQLTNLEGSAEGAKRAMDWIETFATKTPLQVDQTVEAYAKLRAFGLDPTNGTLEALVDTMAATGGSNEMLASTILALGQAQTMSRLRGEEALQLQERGIPVYELLAKKLGKTTAEIIEMQNAGELGREEIALLIEAMGEANKGAAEDMSYTWDGIISNLWDYWSKFQRMVMKSGVFDHLKGRLQSLLTVLNRMAADGTLLRWAEAVSSGVIAMLQGLWDFGAGVVSVWQEVAPWIAWAADKVGGFGNAIGILIGLRYAVPLLALAGAFWKIGVGALWAGSFAVPVLASAIGSVARAAVFLSSTSLALLRGSLAVVGATATFLATTSMWLLRGSFGLVGRAAVFLATVSLVTLQGALALVGRAFASLAFLVRAHPLVAMATALAAAAVMVSLGWSGVVKVFEAIFAAAEKFFKYVTGWSFADVTATITSAFNIDLYAAGVAIMTSLWNGMKSMFAMIGSGTKAFFAELANTDTSAAMAAMGAQNPARTDYPGSFDYRGPGRITPGGVIPGTDGARSTGGPVRAGGIYRWQENGMEFFRPKMDGVVYNARASRAIATAQTPTMARMAPVVAMVTALMADMPAASPAQGTGGDDTGFAQPVAMRPTAPILRAPRAQSGARTTTVNLGGIVINAAPGQSPQAIAREVMALAERKFASGGSLALHDGGDYDV